MIQAILLISLGFLSASLIGVLLAPALWSRAVRLSRKRLERRMPITLSDIEASRDQLRASYAVRIRRLETALASAKQKAALQLVDNSRLQMQIASLKDEIADLGLKLAERRNAATVLEQAITKRFPELDREITAVKERLRERSYEIQDLTNRLSRRGEELEAAERAAASHQEELARLRQVLEKSSADRGGRRLRRASQWNLEDYRAEYDRLNLDLSKLRQQLAQLQERDARQTGVIKEDLQKLAELILSSAQPKAEVRAERLEPAAKRTAAAGALRQDRPVPWPGSTGAAAIPAGIGGGSSAEAPDGARGGHAAPRSRLLREAVAGKPVQHGEEELPREEMREAAMSQAPAESADRNGAGAGLAAAATPEGAPQPDEARPGGTLLERLRGASEEAAGSS